jgi:hypothetical protein
MACPDNQHSFVSVEIESRVLSVDPMETRNETTVSKTHALYCQKCGGAGYTIKKVEEK